VTDELDDRPIVVDASVAVTWCIFADSTDATDRMLLVAARTGILVPAIWWFEVANALVSAQRRNRLGPEDWSRFENMLSHFKIEAEPIDPFNVVANVSRVSRNYGLTVYDAGYLELAIRRNARLATLDKALIAAAPNVGVTLFNP
jgi:predicted nucleic acid-binding protein